MIYLIRHAWAGERAKWEGDDRRRPLDGRGRRQAAQLAELLAAYEIDRVLSSPYVRCVQTVEPLARVRALKIERREELSEERQDVDGVRLVRSLSGFSAVSCHGGLSEVLCGLHQRKGDVFAFEQIGAELRLAARFRAKG